MNKRYAVQITRRHLDLVTMLNGGLAPHESMRTGKYWFLFEIDKESKDSINHEIVPERVMLQTHDIAGSFPIFMRLKKY